MFARLTALFETDERLKTTIPASYEVDPQKVKLWNELNDYAKQPMEVVKVSFQDWQAAFASCLEHILGELNKGRFFIMSTGVSLLKKQSASELWTFYIAKKMLEMHDVQFDDIDQHWTLVSKGKRVGKVDILFVDDFMNSGCHMSQRVCSSKFPTQDFGRILVAAGIAPSDCQWRDCMEDIQNEYDVHIIDHMEVHIGKIIEVHPGSHLLFDHKSLEELYDDLHHGYIGAKGYIGSLLLGAEPSSPHQHPPALYHIAFGNGELPKSHTQLIPIGGQPGFFENSKWPL